MQLLQNMAITGQHLNVPLHRPGRLSRPDQAAVSTLPPGRAGSPARVTSAHALQMTPVPRRISQCPHSSARTPPLLLLNGTKLQLMQPARIAETLDRHTPQRPLQLVLRILNTRRNTDVKPRTPLLHALPAPFHEQQAPPHATCCPQPSTHKAQAMCHPLSTHSPLRDYFARPTGRPDAITLTPLPEGTPRTLSPQRRAAAGSFGQLAVAAWANVTGNSSAASRKWACFLDSRMKASW